MNSGYPLNLSGTSGGGVGASNSLVGYSSFPMTEPTAIQMVSNSKINTRSANVSSSNDRDESPMMCVQQSPVVIH